MTDLLKILTVILGIAFAFFTYMAVRKPYKKLLFSGLAFGSVVAGLILGFLLWQEEKKEQRQAHQELLEYIQDLKGELIKKATLKGFQKELEEVSEEKK